ncbi:MAG TPA: response regulator [Aggregatilineales bacterium]|nr:response regulator [Aggregatilineales bacterium]
METQNPPSAFVIDDEFFNRDIFRIALESAGYVVAEAETGEGGLAVLAARTFDLLILDLHIPGMSGREILKRVRAMPQHDKMQVTVVTANIPMATDDIQESADFVMYKPIDVAAFSKFVNRLKQVFAGNKD